MDSPVDVADADADVCGVGGQKADACLDASAEWSTKQTSENFMVTGWTGMLSLSSVRPAI